MTATMSAPSAPSATATFTPLEGPAAVVLADSISAEGVRLISFETVMHRFVLSENNTHKVVGKCAGSNRAIPVSKKIDMLRANPAYPLRWAAEKPGMQGGDPLTVEETTLARHKWRQTMETAIKTALDLRELGLHKSVTNRLLEPFEFIRVVQTATAWDNFLDLRDHADAQPEIAAVARLMREARDASTPTLLEPGQWHLPYVSDRDRDEVRFRAAKKVADDPVARSAHKVGVEKTLAKISAARCARTSYLTNPVIGPDGQVVEEAKVDLVKDLSLVERLLSARPRHWSPFEHQATPWAANRQTEDLFFEDGEALVRVPTGHLPRVGNLLGWRHQRTETEALLSEVTYR
ncbi:hypothetical protein [Nocardioides pakistanensis]